MFLHAGMPIGRLAVQMKKRGAYSAPFFMLARLAPGRSSA